MKPEYIIIHHSLTRDSGTVSWAAIRSYHMKVLGYRAIGYHYGIEYVTNPYDQLISYEILLGRYPGEQGAHCIPRNRDSIGVDIIGNFDEAIPDPKIWNKAVELVAWLRVEYGIGYFRVLGHREAQANRTCPGKFFDMNAFRDAVERKFWNRAG
jgi:N-acetylmuramoyl-L-alanine amidase